MADVPTGTAPPPLVPERNQTNDDFVYLTMLIGMPGSMIAAVLVSTLMMGYGQGADIQLWIGLVVVMGAFLGTMGAGWFAQAHD